MSITLDQAKNLGYGTTLEHTTLKNADGTPMRFRVSGMVKTWKRDPNRIKVPVKHGLYDNGYIVNDTFEGGGFNLNLNEINL